MKSILRRSLEQDAEFKIKQAVSKNSKNSNFHTYFPTEAPPESHLIYQAQLLVLSNAKFEYKFWAS